MIKREISRRKGGAIRLSIPVKVAYNADAFRNSIHGLLDELGCKACFSGVDCYFTTIRDFVLTPEKNSLRQAQIGEVSHIANPSRQGIMEPQTLNIGMSPKASFNIKSVDLAIKNILEDIGCLGCCSGVDPFFQSQFDRFIS